MIRSTDLARLFTDDEGVSPVIGVILMVAVVVILSAVIGAFVMGMGDSLSQSAPQTNLRFKTMERTSEGVTVGAVITGGDAITDAGTTAIRVYVDGEPTGLDPSPWPNNDAFSGGDSSDTIQYWVDELPPTPDYDDTGEASFPLTAGDKVGILELPSLDPDDGDTWVEEGDTVRIIWVGNDGTANHSGITGTSQTIAQYTV